MANHLRKDTRKKEAAKKPAAKKPVQRAPCKKAIPVEFEEIVVIQPEIAPFRQESVAPKQQTTYFKVVAWLKKLFGK